jgi:hypothetical protein
LPINDMTISTLHLKVFRIYECFLYVVENGSLLPIIDRRANCLWAVLPSLHRMAVKSEMKREKRIVLTGTSGICFSSAVKDQHALFIEVL